MESIFADCGDYLIGSLAATLARKGPGFQPGVRVGLGVHHGVRASAGLQRAALPPAAHGDSTSGSFYHSEWPGASKVTAAIDPPGNKPCEQRSTGARARWRPAGE